MDKLKRLYNIDFLRFGLAWMIVLTHLSVIVDKFYNTKATAVMALKFGHCGFAAVPAFFFMAGFFLYRTSVNNQKKFSDFITFRIFRLWPVLAFSFLISLLFGRYKPYVDTMNLFFINSGLGLLKWNESSSNSAVWFIGVLLFLSIFFRYFICELKRKHLIFLCSVITFLSFSVLIKIPMEQLGYSKVVMPSLGLTSGFVTGLGSMGLGVLFSAVFGCADKIKCQFGKIKILMFSLFELYVFIYYCTRVIYRSKVYENSLYWLLIFSVIFLLFYVNKGVLSQTLNNKFFGKLGEYSYCIYVLHLPVIILLKKYYIYMNVTMAMFSTIFIILLISIITYYLIEKPTYIYLKNTYERIKY
ncbi:acyltransferase [bacterium]|nr:acyltransferase [bacterium]